MKTIFKNISPLLYNVRKYRNYVAKKRILKDPRIEANKTYKSVFNKDINWNNPTDLIEKIYWLQFNTDTSLWTEYADKYLVRNFIKEQGFKSMLNELYGVWKRPEDIEWDKLPDSFVLKTTNGCGQIVVVKNKKDCDKHKIIKNLTQWIKVGYGYQGAQLHYTKIKPRIIAEKLFVNKNNSKLSIIDYKILCLNGEPECILVVYNRSKDGYLLSLYDLEWNNISENAFNEESNHFSGVEVKKPKSLDQMINTSKILAKDFPQVRVDFYEIDDKPIFGEMTFTTGFGYYSDEYYKYLGSKIDLSEVKKL